tara:strand:+ start:90 stop:1988 length:1899 start_codon:yes stop_codon:yes gene_type:complete
MNTFLYFAYGSNMLTERLRARCPSAKPVGVAFAANYALEFSKKSKDASGKATLVPQPGVQQFGALFEIDSSERTELDKAEGVGSGYQRIDNFLVTHSSNGEQVPASTYLATEPEANLKPFDWYLALVVAGAKQQGLPSEQLSILRLASYVIDDETGRKGRCAAIEALRASGAGQASDVLSITTGDLVLSIVMELQRVQNMSPADIRKNDDFALPRAIDAGNGRSLLVSRKLDEDIASYAKKVMDQDPSIKPRFTQKDWRALVRRTFGPILASIELDDALSLIHANVSSQLKQTLSDQLIRSHTKEYAFGCTLFGNNDVQAFEVGPVRFEPRHIWLERKYSDRSVSTTTKRRVEATWRGNQPRERKPSFDSNSETNIIDAIGGCAFVCSVKTSNLAADAGREKALTVARLATTVIALQWQVPSTVLAGMNLLYDRKPHLRRDLASSPGGKVWASTSWSHPPHGPTLKSGEWENDLDERAKVFAVAGHVLESITCPTGVGHRSALMSTLTHALWWFHEGCRETTTHMAIVKFAASLDALAGGGKESGIRQLLKVRAGWQDDSPIGSTGRTLKQTVKLIYSNGRSRTIHGNNSELGNDWSDVKNLAEQLGRIALITCLNWVADNPSCTDPKRLSS